MLNKNFVFVTSSTFETSLVPIQFSDVYVIQLLRIALLLVFRILRDPNIHTYSLFIGLYSTRMSG